MNSHTSVFDPAAAPPTSTSGLGDRERLVLLELAGEHDARVGFQGLRRRLGLHPQALTRTLRGLQRSGFINRAQDGYQLLAKGAESLADAVPSIVEPAYVTAVRALLPTHLDPRDVARHLSGRWFRGLHWYGKSDDQNDVLLVWCLESGAAKVRLRLTHGTLLLEVESDPADPTKHLQALKPLLEAVSELYGDVPQIPRPAE